VEYKETAINIGLRIQTLRQEKNLSQLDLASLCNIERSNLSRIEAGKTNLTLRSMISICKALDISLAELLNTTDKK
jgi:transcriptional regulator with XRE-family HTH domain